MAKPRKSLDDRLAENFVYGDKDTSKHERKSQETDSKSPQTSKVSKNPIKKTSIVNKLQEEEKEPTVRLTVDLPQSKHRKLSILAAKTGKKKAEIVRLLLDEALEEVEE